MKSYRKAARGLVAVGCMLLAQSAALGAPASPAEAPPREAERLAPGASPPSARETPAATQPPDSAGPSEEPPPDAVAAPPADAFYRRIDLEVTELVWLEPGQRGLIEAHPLIMGLAAMALATVALLFFFLRGVKRPKDEDL